MAARAREWGQVLQSHIVVMQDAALSPRAFFLDDFATPLMNAKARMPSAIFGRLARFKRCAEFRKRQPIVSHSRCDSEKVRSIRMADSK